MARSRSLAVLIGMLLALGFPLGALAQELAHRLILKDGSYQSVTKYEVHGDRVRYFSAEREEWEELPKDLVDWSATDKYEKDRAAGAAVPEAVQLDKEIEHEQEVEQQKLPQVAPGLRLPEYFGVFLLDSYQGEIQLVEIDQTAGDVNRNSKANILRGVIPAAGAKQTVELEGAHAAVQSHVDVPSLFINVDQSTDPLTSKSGAQQPQQPQQPEQPRVPFDRYRIVHTEVKNGKRIVGDVKRQVTGKVTQEQHVVTTNITSISGGWLKLTPIEPLQPGEYALVELNEKEGMNLYVWDFGVNPKAPANTNPWKPDAKQEAKPADTPKE